MQHAERSDRITLRPLGLRLVLPYARRARGVGPARDLPAKRKRKRARAGRPMATRGAGSGGRREGKSLASRSARCGSRLPATADGVGLLRGSVNVVRQLGGVGTRMWRRRGRQVAVREAIRAWIAARKGDGPRVRDTATHLASGQEQVEHRDTRRGVEPRCLAEAGGK